jgi:hypothetical protein
MQSPTIAELAKALCKFQGSLKNPVKDSTNPFFKSKYATLDAVWEAIRTSLCENGLSVVQSFDPELDTDIGLVQLTTTLLHNSGEWISGTLTMKPVKNDPQGMGSAITYARRYALAALVGVAPEEDDDGNAASQPSPKKTDNQNKMADEFEQRLNKPQEPITSAPNKTSGKHPVDSGFITEANKKLALAQASGPKTDAGWWEVIRLICAEPAIKNIATSNQLEMPAVNMAPDSQGWIVLEMAVHEMDPAFLNDVVEHARANLKGAKK